MTEINLTQTEADALIAMAKVRVDDQQWDYPLLGGSICVPLLSENRREQFFLDISRGSIDLAKGTYQNRSHQTVILIRLDFGGRPHRNPDGEEVPSPHLHVYREDYGDKWAMTVPADRFPKLEDMWQTLLDFMDFCNIIEPPSIQRGLFI